MIAQYRRFGPALLVSTTYTSNPTVISGVSATRQIVIVEIKFTNISGVDQHVTLIQGSSAVDYINVPVDGMTFWEPPAGRWFSNGPIRARLEFGSTSNAKIYVSGLYEIVKTA